MKRRIYQTGFILFAVFMLTGGCSKYEEGPVFSLYAKEGRFQGRWYFSRVMYNDIDSTDVYKRDPVQALEFLVNPERKVKWNAYTWNHNMAGSSTVPMSVDYGYWRLSDEKDSLLMVTTMNVGPDRDPVADTVSYGWRIIRLAYTELWMERMLNDTTRIEWQLWKRTF